MFTKPDPTRASHSPSASPFEPPSALGHVPEAHRPHHPQQPQPQQQQRSDSALSFNRLEITSTPRTSTSGFATDYPSARSSFSQEVPEDDINSYTGRPVLNTSRRYSSGFPTPTPPPIASTSSVRTSTSLGNIYSTPGSNPGNKRRPAPSLAPTPESLTTGAHVPLAGIRSTSTGFHTFAPDFVSSQDPEQGSIHQSAPHSPSFSISSFSGILPSSASITSIISSVQTKPPGLEYKLAIAVKDLDSIHILSPSHRDAIKTLCSSRVLSRIDTLGWHPVLGAHKFPSIHSRYIRPIARSG